MNARCLACQAGQTIADYCAANEKVVGCENRGKIHHNKLILFLFIIKILEQHQSKNCQCLIFSFLENGRCCYAMTARCLACNQGESVADYCKANPNTEGCQPWGNIFIYLLELSNI